MSVSNRELLRSQLARGEYEQAEKTARLLSLGPALKLEEFIPLFTHAVCARQAALATILIEDNNCFLAPGSYSPRQKLEELTSLINTCVREKLEKAARALLDTALQL